MEAQPSAAPAQAPDAAADEHLNHPTNVKIREATACKEKGTEHFTAGAYQDAVEAYVEGAAIAGTVEGAYRSKVAQDLRTACLCNAAQARLKEQKWTDAVDLCSQAVTIDARCVKALFRRGCARLELKQYDDARSDLAAALEVEPQNKAVKNKLVDAERTQMEEAKRSKGMNNYDRFAKIDLSDDEQEATDTSTPPPPTAPPTAPPPATKQRSPPAAAAKPTPAAAPQEGTDGETSAYEKKPGTGYRYWANAPSAPRVIPKKIDPSEAPQLGQQDSGGGSVWNKAGTYEEKDQTEWAKGHLGSAIGALSLALEDGSSAKCTALESFEGDVGVHLVRGKKRYIWDVRFTIKFEVDLKDAERVCTGEIEVTDFSSADPSDWEANLRWVQKPPAPMQARAAAVLGKSLHTESATTICGCVHTALLHFIEAFKQR